MEKINLPATAKYLNKVCYEYRKPGLILSKFASMRFFEEEANANTVMCTIYRDTSYGKTSMFNAVFGLTLNEDMFTVEPLGCDCPDAIDLEKTLQDAASVITTMLMEP